MLEFWILRILTTISVFQILLISFYLFIRKRGNTYNRLFVSLLLIIWGIFITGSFILLTPKLKLITYDYGHLLSLTVFLVAPVLYVHFSVLFEPDYKIKLSHLRHLLPFAIIFSILFYEIVIARRLYYVFYPTAIYLISFLFLQNIFYFYLLLKRMLLIPYSNGNRPKLKLYRVLLISTVIFFFLKLIVFLIWNVLKYTDICIHITDIFFVAVFVIINSLVIFSLNNTDVLLGVFKYQNSGIPKHESFAHFQKIANSFIENKLYTDPLLSLERLAKQLKMPVKVLSQVINQESCLNFNDFINKYRIELASQIIQSSPEKKILEVAYECGFNSKTTFNQAFKKFTGKTPTQLKEEYLG